MFFSYTFIHINYIGGQLLVVEASRTNMQNCSDRPMPQLFARNPKLVLVVHEL